MTENTKSNKSFYERKKEAGEKAREDYGDLQFHYATIDGGKKHPQGAQCEVHWIGATSPGGYIQAAAKIFFPKGKKDGWINPKFLKKGKALPAKRKAELVQQSDDEQSETVLIEGTVQRETEAGGILLKAKDWFKSEWFNREMISRAAEGETHDIFEVPAWKVKQLRGPADLEALEAKQEALQKLVDAA